MSLFRAITRLLPWLAFEPEVGAIIELSIHDTQWNYRG